MRRWLLWTVLGVLLAAAGGIGGRALYRKATYGTEYSAAEPKIAVSTAEIFTLAVPDRGDSVGDSWTASTSDEDVVSQVGSTLKMDSLVDRLFGPALGGGGGQRLITFRAKTAGTVTVALSNCFQGCSSERTRAESRTVSWSVTVKP